MRAIIACTQGLGINTSNDEVQRQRELMKLYRWVGNGLGLGV